MNELPDAGKFLSIIAVPSLPGPLSRLRFTGRQGRRLLRSHGLNSLNSYSTRKDSSSYLLVHCDYVCDASYARSPGACACRSAAAISCLRRRTAPGCSRLGCCGSSTPGAPSSSLKTARPASTCPMHRETMVAVRRVDEDGAHEALQSWLALKVRCERLHRGSCHRR